MFGGNKNEQRECDLNAVTIAMDSIWLEIVQKHSF